MSAITATRDAATALAEMFAQNARVGFSKDVADYQLPVFKCAGFELDETKPSTYRSDLKVIANGSLKIELPLVDGTTVVYSAVPATEWRFVREAPAGRKARLVEAQAPTPSQRAKAHIDAVLGILAGIESAATHLASTATAIAAD